MILFNKFAGVSKGRDLETFKFLFAKKDSSQNAKIEGRLYKLDIEQELILDFWERYTRWYRKEEVVVTDESGDKHAAIIYTMQKQGKKLIDFNRVPVNYDLTLANARKLKKMVESGGM